MVLYKRACPGRASIQGGCTHAACAGGGGRNEVLSPGVQCLAPRVGLPAKPGRVGLFARGWVGGRPDIAVSVRDAAMQGLTCVVAWAGVAPGVSLKTVAHVAIVVASAIADQYTITRYLY